LGEDFWFWALTLGVAVLGGGATALRWLKFARLIEDTPTSRVRSAAQGYVELSGRGLPLEGTTNPAPLTQRPCVWWRYRIAKKHEGTRGRSDSWQTVSAGQSALPFLLDDGTGRCIVQPEGAEVVASEGTTWYGDTPWPVSAPGSPLGTPGQRTYRYFEERIYEQERVYGLGEFRSHGQDRGQDVQAATAALLTGWKSDQDALIKRFDVDRDGKISLDEWSQAREEARRTVEQTSAAGPPLETLHVLSRPDSGQLFLLAALPAGDLAKRYRRKAALAFVGFVAAAYALGWLLQRAFG
jgi:hypothetical protein